MCLTESVDGAKAKTIFEAIDEKFTNDRLPYDNCVSLSVDNASAMIGKHNCVASRFIQKKSGIFYRWVFMQLKSYAASHANDAFTEILRLNTEDVSSDIFHWFDKSSKRKGKLMEYCFEFCDQEYRDVLKHISFCWLSLEKCIAAVY